MSVWKRKVENSKFEDRELIPAGQYPAVLVAMIDIGHQETKKFQSSEYEWVHKVVLAWELVGMAGRPVVIKDFRLSLANKAALRKFLEGWRGKSYNDAEDIDLSKLVGQPCLLKIAHNKSGDNTFHGVESASMPTLGGQKIDVAKPEHQPLLWSVEDNHVRDLPEWLPYLYGKSLAERVESSREFAGEEEAAGDEFDPDAKDVATMSTPMQGSEIPF